MNQGLGSEAMDETHSKVVESRRCDYHVKRAFKRLLVERDGAAALDFAFTLVPFLLLTIGLLETGMLMFVSTQLEGAVHDASRQIRTGQVQNALDPAAEFEGLLCDALVVAIACDERLVVDVRSFDNFSSMTFPEFFDTDGIGQDLQFSPGNPGDTVVVRVAYSWKVMTPFMSKFLSNMSGDRRMIATTAIFKVEPFTPGGGGAGAGGGP